MINESLPTPRYVLPLIYLMFLIDNGEITLLREKITQSSNSSVIKFQALNFCLKILFGIIINISYTNKSTEVMINFTSYCSWLISFEFKVQ